MIDSQAARRIGAKQECAMALREEYVASGNWLFRWRSYVPLGIIGLLLLAMGSEEYPGHYASLNRLWELFALGVSLFGLAIRAYTIGHTPKGTSGRNTREQIAEKLNTSGIYSVVRHPLYLGNFFMFLGVVLFPGLWWIALISVLTYWVYYERIMFAEEDFLRTKFGGQFDEWAARTPAFIPSWRHWRKPDLPFSFRNVLKREYNGFYAVIVLFTLFKIISDYHAYGHLEFDPMWSVIFSAGTAVFLILRTLRRHTRLLSVDGR
jgi:protein-S-isoprenylcysteine O-methyltransferase Ste14